MKFYLVTTDHLKSTIWFRDEEDFKAAMNIIPVLAALAGVNILSFILMSNHIHFVLECELADAEAFILKFKKLKTANRGEIIESRNNAMRIALAFICALIAWFFVTMKFYPSRPKSYSGVTLSTELEADSQLEIMSVSKNNIKVLTVDVDFECSRYDYNSIKLGNLEAYIDTADITKPGK